jgi:peptidoglycan biosynthesis protein MviN/MurJ (putative lipid II flippase)
MRPQRLLSGVLTVGGWTMLSRVLGFVRDLMIANLLGPGVLMDAYVAAFRLPNMFRRFSPKVRLTPPSFRCFPNAWRPMTIHSGLPALLSRV